MRRASKLINDQDRQRVTQAVAQAEASTSAEIVPVLASSSGRYDRAEDVVGLWLGVAAMVVVGLALPERETAPGGWGGVSELAKLGCQAGAVFAGFVIGAVVGGWVWRVRRMFTPTAQMRSELQAKARGVFFDQRVHHTAGGSGLMIYVSLYERMATVLGDQQVIEKLGQTGLEQMCDAITEDLRKGSIVDALCLAVERAGSELGGVLPHEGDNQDTNELADALVVLD